MVKSLIKVLLPHEVLPHNQSIRELLNGDVVCHIRRDLVLDNLIAVVYLESRNIVISNRQLIAFRVRNVATDHI